MTAYNEDLFDDYGRVVRPVLCNTAKDGSGTWYFALVDSDGHMQVDVLSSIRELHEVRVVKAIDASDGAYAANDVVNDDNCCTTADPWTFTSMAAANGGEGKIYSATIFSETRNIEPRLTLLLFNASPTGMLQDNVANTNPLPADRAKYIGRIEFPALNKVSAHVASTSSATPSTVGGLPLGYKCAAGTTSVYGVLVAEDAFTQVATEDIEITLMVEHC